MSILRLVQYIFVHWGDEEAEHVDSTGYKQSQLVRELLYVFSVTSSPQHGSKRLAWMALLVLLVSILLFYWTDPYALFVALACVPIVVGCTWATLGCCKL